MSDHDNKNNEDSKVFVFHPDAPGVQISVMTYGPKRGGYVHIDDGKSKMDPFGISARDGNLSKDFQSNIGKRLGDAIMAHLKDSPAGSIYYIMIGTHKVTPGKTDEQQEKIAEAMEILSQSMPNNSPFGSMFPNMGPGPMPGMPMGAFPNMYGHINGMGTRFKPDVTDHEPVRSEEKVRIEESDNDITKIK